MLQKDTINKVKRQTKEWGEENKRSNIRIHKKTVTTQQQKYKQPNLKLGKGYE